MTAIEAKKPAAPPARRFQWRDQNMECWYPEEMETRHLFYAVCMIWNHSMPTPTWDDFRRYHFGPSYTPEYFARAVRAMLPELLRRDLDAERLSVVEWMAAWLRGTEVPPPALTHARRLT